MTKGCHCRIRRRDIYDAVSQDIGVFYFTLVSQHVKCKSSSVLFRTIAGTTAGVMVIGYPLGPATMPLVGDLNQYIPVYQSKVLSTVLPSRLLR